MRRKRICKKKLVSTLVSFIFCVWVGFLLLPNSTEGSCRINDISLEKDGNYTKLTICAEKPFEFVHSTSEEKDGKPYRVIIDCRDAIHNLPQHNFKKDLPLGTIEAIRTSQYQTEPEKIVRIVLDLNKPVIYKVVEEGKEGRGAIAILTTQDPSFPFWSAAKNEKSSTESKLASSASVEKTTQGSSETKENLSGSSENKSRSGLDLVENAKREEAQKKTTFERPLSFADTLENKVAPALMAKPEAEKSELGSTEENLENKEKTSEQRGEKIILATPLTSPEVFLAPDQKNRKLQSEHVEDKKGGTNIEKETSKSSSLKPFSQTPPKIEKKESRSESQKLSLIEDSEQTRTKETSVKSSNKEEYIPEERLSSPKEALKESETKSINLPAREVKEHIKKEPFPSHQEVVASVGEAEKSTTKPPQGGKTDSLNLVVKEEKVASLSPQKKSSEEEAGSSESLVVASQPQGTVAEVVGQRKLIHYDSEGKRDPFTPLTERISAEFGQVPLPIFESLKLVGILRDKAGNRALLEDERGYGYILKNGDLIKNGYVVSVEDHQVIFQITEYGWSKSMVLELPN